MKLIPLTRGKAAIVDDEDYEYLSSFKWQAASKSSGFYACRYFELPMEGKARRRKRIYMHHLVIGGPWKRFEPHHKNGNSLDNRRCNLEKLTERRHKWQRSKQRNPALSKYLGVSRWGGIWYAQMHRGRTRIRLAACANEITAARKFDEWVRELRGPNARTNF